MQRVSERGDDVLQRVAGLDHRLPQLVPDRDVVEACVGGESNAIGIFYAFLEDPTQCPRDGD